jgi:DNA polymerase-3 subunit beta
VGRPHVDFADELTDSFRAYERVIPKGNDKDIEFERERLTNAVKRVALLSNERSRAVKFEIAKGTVDVTSSSSEFGEAREQLTVDYEGTSLAISFNAQYILDFLNVADNRCGFTLTEG